MKMADLFNVSMVHEGINSISESKVFYVTSHYMQIV